MELLASGRRNGKTTKMITWWLVDPENRIILSPNIRMRNHCLNRFRELILNGRLSSKLWPLAQRQFIASPDQLRGTASDVGVDNYDLLSRRDREELRHIGHRVKVVTED